jgi:hypothetical protein
MVRLAMVVAPWVTAYVIDPRSGDEMVAADWHGVIHPLGVVVVVVSVPKLSDGVTVTDTGPPGTVESTTGAITGMLMGRGVEPNVTACEV